MAQGPTGRPALPLWPGETSTGSVSTAGGDPNPSRGGFLSPPQPSGMAQRGGHCWGSLRSPGLCSGPALYKPGVNGPKHQEALSPCNSPTSCAGPASHDGLGTGQPKTLCRAERGSPPEPPLLHRVRHSKGMSGVMLTPGVPWRGAVSVGSVTLWTPREGFPPALSLQTHWLTARSSQLFCLRLERPLHTLNNTGELSLR